MYAVAGLNGVFADGDSAAVNNDILETFQTSSNTSTYLWIVRKFKITYPE